MSTKKIKELRFWQTDGTSNSKLEATYKDGTKDDRSGMNLEEAHAVAKWFGLEGKFVPSQDLLTVWTVDSEL